MEEIKAILETILKFLDINDFSLESHDDGDVLKLNIKVENAGILIGTGGDTLKDLELILRAILQHKNFEKRIVLDINNYRQSQEAGLKELAKETAHQVMLTKKPVELYAMNAYERRIVHLELATHPDVATESVGEEPNRRLVVRPYP